VVLEVNIIHQYGINETMGQYVENEEQIEWKNLDSKKRALLRIRQGISSIHAGTGLRVVDKNFIEVPCDGKTLGEIIMAGNTLATMYYRNTEDSQIAFRNGWFFSGDIAVVHSDGYIEIRDRIKDLIYIETEYGWENISSIEIENILSEHSAISDVAVICLPIDLNNSIPILIAYVELYQNINLRKKDFFYYCEKNLSIYMHPRYVYFMPLPKTSTGKVLKNILLKDARQRIAKST